MGGSSQSAGREEEFDSQSVTSPHNDTQVSVEDQTQSSPTNQEADARLASRLDDTAPSANAENALHEAQLDAKSEAQSQEADALMEDLFGAGPAVKETAEGQGAEEAVTTESKKAM